MTVQKYNVQIHNHIHKIKVDSLFPIKFANTILLQLPRTCFAVLVVVETLIQYILMDVQLWSFYILISWIRLLFAGIFWSCHLITCLPMSLSLLYFIGLLPKKQYEKNELRRVNKEEYFFGDFIFHFHI